MIIGIFILPLLLYPALASDTRLIVSTGTCNRDIQPDRGSIVLTADVLDRDMNQSLKRANATYEATRMATQNLKLADAQLSTVEYSTQKQNDWQNNRTVFKGYRTRIGLKVTTSDLKRLGEVIPVAAQNQVKDIGQISVYLSNETLRRERGACLKEAVENARAKADKIAQGLGVALGQATLVRELSDEGESAPRPMMANAAMALESAAKSAPHIEPGQQTVQAAVQASFSFK